MSGETDRDAGTGGAEASFVEASSVKSGSAEPGPADTIRVEVIRAWPRRHVACELHLRVGAVLGDALAACDIDQQGVQGHAVFGERAEPDRPLRDGDRVELLSGLQADPKQARRQRAKEKDRRRD